MKLPNPEHFDLMRLLHLRPKKPTEDDKRHGTFNRRMIAASLDSMLITMTIAPIVDYFFLQAYGPTSFDVGALTARLSTEPNTGEAMRQFLEELKSSGYYDRWVENFKWQFYALCIYTTICWHYWSATPGKMLCGLKIIDAKTGGKMGGVQSIVRVVCYIVSAFPFALGFFWIGIDRKRRGWHDLIAGTQVVRTPLPDVRKLFKTKSAP